MKSSAEQEGEFDTDTPLNMTIRPLLVSRSISLLNRVGRALLRQQLVKTVPIRWIAAPVEVLGSRHRLPPLAAARLLGAKVLVETTDSLMVTPETKSLTSLAGLFKETGGQGRVFGMVTPQKSQNV